MTSRGGNVYDRTFLEGHIKPGIGLRNWVSRTNYPALNFVQTSPTEMSFYINRDYASPTAHLRRYSLRLDGFASIRAGASGGELVTRPFSFTGNSLSVNFATSAGGGIRFELQDSSGASLPGFSLDECRELIGNELDRVVEWNKSPIVTPHSGKTIRLRCVLKDANLFAIQLVKSK